MAWLANTVRISARSASISCVRRTRCSWDSSHNASKRSVRESTGSSKSGAGLEGAAVVVVEVVEKRTARCPPGDRPRVQSGPDSHEARPCPRVHDLNRRSPQVVVHPVCPS